jgi:hypothetical protein
MRQSFRKPDERIWRRSCFEVPPQDVTLDAFGKDVWMPTHFKATERCLLSILLEHDSDTKDDRAGIDELLAGVEALTSGWLVPLASGSSSSTAILRAPSTK